MAKTSWFLGGVMKKEKKNPKYGVQAPKFCDLNNKLMLPNAGSYFVGTDPEKERDPPPEPTRVTFPLCEQAAGRAWTQDHPPPNFQSLFSRIVKPSDISDQHVTALNISVLPVCCVQELVPAAPDGTPYHELPISASTPISVPHETPRTPEGQNVSKRKEFDERLAELKIDNDLAFRTLSKTVATGIRPPRIAHMRKFFVGLESMSQYWDCSLDRYYEVNEADRGENGEQAVKRQRLERDLSPKGSPMELSTPTLEDASQVTWSKTSRSHSEHTELPAVVLTTECVEGQDTTHEPPAISPLSVNPVPQTRTRYKGRRTSTGREMPDQFRADTVRAFVEGICWTFRGNISNGRAALELNKLILPVRQTGTVCRLPNDKWELRHNWREGPIMRVQARAETEFLDDSGEQRELMVRLDYLREIAALLQLAQERRREGREEVKPGEGKWWTSKPRWGGGSGGEVQNEIGNTDVLQVAEEVLDASQKTKSKKLAGHVNGKEPKKKTPAISWKELKVGTGNWTPKIHYTAIGKDPSSEWDEVFLVSSLNHHISILKLTVHGAYVDYLTSATMPQPLPDDAEWSVPKLQRTQWFDLFDVEQRVEAFRGLWGVMAYLTRETGQASQNP